MKDNLKKFSYYKLPLRVYNLEQKSSDIPLGTDRQVLGYVEGEPQAITLGWSQFSDLSTPPPFETGVLSGINFNVDGSAMYYFHELNSAMNAEAKTGTIPVYGTGGVLKISDGIVAKDAVSLGQLNNRIPTPPTTGTFVLRSVNGVVSWVTE